MSQQVVEDTGVQYEFACQLLAESLALDVLATLLFFGQIQLDFIDVGDELAMHSICRLVFCLNA